MKNFKYYLFAIFALICLLLSQCDSKSESSPAPVPEQVDTPRASAQEVFGVACQNCTPTPIFVQYEPEPPTLNTTTPTLPMPKNANADLLTYLAIGVLGLLGFVVKDDRESRRAHQSQLNDIALAVERIEAKIDNNNIKNQD